jgi:aspartate racemase
MKTLGLIGGMSWESTQSYYRLLNLGVKERLGGLHSANIILYSVDFAPIEAMQREGKWDQAGKVLEDAAHALEKAGAELLLLCTNTMHKVEPIITHALNIPFIHIANATAKALQKANKHHAILLGTKFTMQEDFYTSVLEKEGIRVTIPDAKAIETINRIIFDELCLGLCEENSKQYFLDTIHHLYHDDKSIDSVILGCTEIGLLLEEKDSFLPLFDTTLLHVNEALHHAL